MGELSKDVSQLSLGVNLTLVRVMCGSPAGMKNLIKYFESQSKRLDRQTIHSQPLALNSNFESMIKFNGVPILPPALTSSRRDELKQYKKDAILLEKRQKARQRKQLLAKADSLVTESQAQMTFPDTNSRPTARQLNFDSGDQEEAAIPNTLKERLGATNPFSTFATAETGMMEDFGLQTMDSVNSDFMSLDGASIPAVFNGLALTSFKEQKISYDLDRLSKVLNVQDLTSTSGSDLSDALGNTQNLDEEDLQSAEKLAQKFLAQRPGEGADGQSTSFFHESQDTVVEVSPEPGCERASVDNTSTSGFIDNTNSSNHEQNSVGSSPSCGSANTTGTMDSQRSNRSSPKSLKNAVHFASFVTEYNTSASQSFERPTIVKKKISNEIQDDLSTDGNSAGNPVLPIIGDPSEARQKHLLSRKVSDSESSSSNSGGLLNRVSLNPDSDTSPNTPPFEASKGMPFQNYGRSESYSSDKENDGSKTHKNIPHGHKKSSEHGGRERHQGNGEESQLRGRQRKISGGDTKSKREDEHKHNSSSIQYSDSQFSVQSSIASAGVGPQELQATSENVGASQVSSTSSEAPATVSTSQVSVGISSGIVSVGQASVSDSQGSNKSNTLTGTSESSNSTIRDDISARDSGNLAMNIVESGHGSVPLDPEAKGKLATSNGEVGKGKNQFESPRTGSANEQSHSPKKLNTDYSNTEVEVKDDKTPPRALVRRGSYTLSEPSPALVKARSRLAEEREKEEKQKTKTESKNLKAMGPKEKTGVKKLTQKQPQVASSRETLPPEKTKPVNFSVPSDAEREGKAEHINKYLNQVQFQNSMNFSTNSWEVGQIDEDEEGPDFQGDEVSETDAYPLQHDSSVDDGNGMDPNLSVLDVLRSLAESQGSLEHLSVQELLALHQQQMDEKRQSLIALQQKDMEELFVQQRREVMLLEREIKAAQQLEKDQQEFLIQNAPENIKVKARNYDGELSPEHTGNYNVVEEEEDDEDQVPISVIKDSINSLDNRRNQSFNRFSDPNTSVPSLHLQPKSYPQGNIKSGKVGVGKNKSNSKTNIINFSPNTAHEESQTRVKTLDDSFSPRAGPLKDPVGISNRIPEFSPSVSSPRMHRPAVVRSPMKYAGIQRRDGRVVVPPEAHLPEMQNKFAKVTAVAKGFLTRCLLRSDKVQELIKTIKDTREFAFNFQTETPIKKGVFSSQDRALLERIIAQLQAALLDIHDIFFELPCSERMALIAQTRMKENEKRIKASKDSMRSSGPRMSQATLKALERKRKAKEAEASAMMSTSRPKTAPPSTSSPRCKNHTDVRALKPLQGQSFSQISPVKPDSTRSEKDRPRTAPEKTVTRPKRFTAPSSKPATASSQSQSDVNKDMHKDAPSKHATNVSNKTVLKSKVVPSKPSSSRPTKSWR